MAIPGSGAISMSMFNTELGRASNTANSSLAGGSTPAVGSLFWLANQSGSLNQTAPHSMSEWYGYAPTPSVQYVYITNDSLDVPITAVEINSVNVTYVSGIDFTINAGDSGIFTTDQFGTYDIQIFYGNNSGNQRIEITDSTPAVDCQNVNSSADKVTYNGLINSSNAIYINVYDGICSI